MRFRVASATIAAVLLVWLGVGAYLARTYQAGIRDARQDSRNLTQAFDENIRRTIEAIDIVIRAIRTARARDPQHFDLMAFERDSGLWKQNTLLSGAMLDYGGQGWDPADAITGTYKAQAVAGTLVPALNTAIWKGQLYAVPDNTNTQLLWYRSDLVPKPPATWAEMIADAEQLAKEGKPHYIEIQGAQYEGGTVWFNTMVSSVVAFVVRPAAAQITLGAPAVKALTIMKQLATSTAADPSMSVQKENENRLQMEAGNAAFMLNYPFVYPGMKMDNPKLFKVFKWALYPSVNPGQPAKVTIGGIDLAVIAYSQHMDLAFQAALCLRNRENQLIGANVGGVPPTIASLYNDPKLFANYPFHADILQALQNASVRPKTPVYQVVSIDISHQISPASSINPTSTLQGMKGSLSNALQSKGLVP